MTDAQVRIDNNYIIALGLFPAGSPDPATIEVVELTPEQEAVVFSPTPGQRVLEDSGVVTIIPPPPPPPVYSQEERGIDKQVQTTDAQPVSLPPFTLHPLTGYSIGVEVMAMADNGVMMHAEYAVVAKRLNQAAIKVGTEAVIARVQDSQASTWVVAFAASGNALVMTVTGVVGRTIDWLVSARIVAFTPQGREPGTE